MVTLPAKLETPDTVKAEVPVLLLMELPVLMTNEPTVEVACKSRIEVPVSVNAPEFAPKVPAPLTVILPSEIVVPPV